MSSDKLYMVMYDVLAWCVRLVFGVHIKHYIDIGNGRS